MTKRHNIPNKVYLRPEQGSIYGFLKDAKDYWQFRHRGVR